MKSIISVIFIIFCLLFFSDNSTAQGVGINESSTAPDPSALLDLNSTNKGFLITRADTSNIVSPAFGLMTLAPKDSCMYLYNGNYWIGMAGAGSNCSCSCGTPSSACEASFADARDGQIYGAVEIGNQCWMSENLNYTPSSGNSYCFENVAANCDIFGRLYDWNTAMDNTPSSSANPSGVQGVCPAGWHIPSDAEWKELEMELGMSQAEADAQGWRGTAEGDALKATSWGGGNNSSGFTALPGGYRSTNGTWSQEEVADWWQATENSSTGVNRRHLAHSVSTIYRGNFSKGVALSIRCVKD